MQELQHCCCDIFFRMWSYHQEQMYSNWDDHFPCSITSKWATGSGVWALATCVWYIYFHDIYYLLYHKSSIIWCYTVLFYIGFIIFVFLCRHFFHIILFYTPLYHESYSTMPYSTMSYSIMYLSNILLHHIPMYHIVLDCIVFFCIVSFSMSFSAKGSF